MGYLQKENDNVIELYNMFSRYRWQTYILAEAATAMMGPGMELEELELEVGAGQAQP